MNEINPDSTVLRQLDGQWQKMAALLLWKLAKRSMVTITVADMEAFAAEFAPGAGVIFTRGHIDSVDFQLVDEAAARRIAAHDATMRGNA